MRRGFGLVPALASALTFATAFLFLPERADASVPSRATRSYEVEKILDNGPDDRRVNVVILGDGYTADQQDLLTERSQAFIEKFVNSSPFTEHAKWINAHVVHVISNESGADYGEAGELRDTALGAYYNCGGTDRVICVDDALVAAVLMDSFDQGQIVLVSVNDSKYGGAAGTYPTFSSAEQAPDIATHEFAHGYAGLADEYADAYPGYPECGSECNESNVSRFSDRDNNKWSHWIEASTQLPTSGDDNTLVGAYEGARYQSTGVFRPIPTCRMRALGYEFCPVCGEALALKVRSQVHAIDEKSPEEDLISDDGCSPLQFSITRLESATASVKWMLDGDEIAADRDEVEVDFSDKAPGKHTLRVEVFDETPLIRKDPDNLRLDATEWEIELEECSQTGDESTLSTAESQDSTSPDGSTTQNDGETDASSGESSDVGSSHENTGSDDDSAMSDSSNDSEEGGEEDEDDAVTSASASCSCQSNDGSTQLTWLGVVTLFALRLSRRKRAATL
jgi:hypothetical protein